MGKETKTFDIAIKYLKDLDFKVVDIFTYIGLEKLHDKIKCQYELYLNDSDNTKSNQHYKDSVFEVAMCHLMDKAHDRVSCFDVACTIVEENTDVIDYSKKEWDGYPKLMEYLWNKYIEGIQNKPKYLSKDEIKGEIFMTAYDYIIHEENKK